MQKVCTKEIKKGSDITSYHSQAVRLLHSFDLSINLSLGHDNPCRLCLEEKKFHPQCISLLSVPDHLPIFRVSHVFGRLFHTTPPFFDDVMITHSHKNTTPKFLNKNIWLQMFSKSKGLQTQKGQRQLRGRLTLNRVKFFPKSLVFEGFL